MTTPPTTPTPPDDERARPGTIHDRRFPERDWRLWALAVLVCAFLAACGAALYAGQAADEAHDALKRANTAIREVTHVERRDRNASRTAAFRLCTRGRADRAFAHARLRGIRVKGEPPSHVPGAAQLDKTQRVAVSRVLMQPEFLPLLDCSPNRDGRGASIMPIRRQEQFLERWAAKRVPFNELGVCPGSVIGRTPPPHAC